MMRFLKNKKGAASFYIVAFSTLVLVIIAASFAAVVISEVARTSNNDLSQSAYDSAMAGVEDAKLAYANYVACLKKGVEAIKPDGDSSLTCEEIVWLVQNPDSDSEYSGCDMVAKIVGRICESCSGEVIIGESTTKNNNMNQAYTCAKIKTVMPDYRAVLNSVNTHRVIKAEFKNKAVVDEIAWVKLSWYTKGKDESLNYTNIMGTDLNSYRVVFQPALSAEASTPPTLMFSLVQTAETFTMADLNGQTVSGQTDRATLYLVPSNSKYVAETDSDTYLGAFNGANGNEISANEVAATNDLGKNLPYVVYCPDVSSSEYGNDEFTCSVKIGIPRPIGGKRNSDTFMFVVSLPYAQPDTEFALEFCTAEGGCYAQNSQEVSVGLADDVAEIEGMQVVIDSTGRANDLFRRVEVRMELANAAFKYPLYVIEALNEQDSTARIEKKLVVTKEWQR